MKRYLSHICQSLDSRTRPHYFFMRCWLRLLNRRLHGNLRFLSRAPRRPTPINLSHDFLSPPDRIGNGGYGRRNSLSAFIRCQLACHQNRRSDQQNSLSTFIHSGAPGVEPHATVALGYQFESTTFVFCSPTAENAHSWGLGDGSSGAGTPTLGCSKNRWVDFEGWGGTVGGWTSRLLAKGGCG
jgi:hypothetical protein